MNSEKYWLGLKDCLSVGNNFNDVQLEQIRLFFNSGWEAYEECLNDNKLLVTDLDSIEHINHFTGNIKRCIGAEESNTFVKLPTLSPIMLTATSVDDMYDIVDMYRDY